MKSLSVNAPTCTPDGSDLSARLTYRAANGVEGALKSSLTANGWTSKRAQDGEDYLAQIKDGRFVNRAELRTLDDDEGGSLIHVDFDSLKN